MLSTASAGIEFILKAGRLSCIAFTASTTEKPRANTHWVETRLDRVLQSRRLGLTLSEVGIDLCDMGQIVSDDEVYVAPAWKATMITSSNTRVRLTRIAPSASVESEMSTVAGSPDIWAKANRVGPQNQTNSAGGVPFVETDH